MCVHATHKKANLISHIREVHEKIRDFKCVMCPYTASRKFYLGNHMKARHKIIWQETRKSDHTREKEQVKKESNKKDVLSQENASLLREMVTEKSDKGINITKLTQGEQSTLIHYLDVPKDDNCEVKTHLTLDVALQMKGYVYESSDIPKNAGIPHKLNKDVLSQENVLLFSEIVPEKSSKYINAAESIHDKRKTPSHHMDMPMDENCEKQIDMEVDAGPQMKEYEYESSNIQDKYEETSEDKIALNCPMCPFQTTTKNVYNEHLINVHEIVEVFDKGHKEGQDESNNGKDNKIEVDTTKKPWQERTYGTKWQEKCVLGCSKCNFTTRNGNQHLKDHERRVHEGVLFKCDICGKTARRKGGIDDHKRRMHEGIKRFKCSLCDWDNYEMNALVRHMKERHHIDGESNIRGAIVKIDWRSKTLKANNKINLPLKEGDPLLIAERQIEVFDNGYQEGRDEYNEEKGNKIKVATTKKTWQERTYGKKWQDKCMLECSKCNFTTRNGSQHLKDHERRVHEGVLFKCDICGKTCNRKGGISDHKRRMHEGVKRFKCSLCDWSDYGVNNIACHVKNMHQIDDDSTIKGAIEKIDWRSSNDKILKSIIPFEEVDLLTAQYSYYTQNMIIQATEQDNPCEVNIEGTWDCKICKKPNKLASQENHLLQYHNLTLTEYLRIQSLNARLNDQVEDGISKDRQDSCLNLETRDKADITQFLNASTWNIT